MGIPHLITHLRPFASTKDLEGQSVVIDGPGLAYHVWHICLASNPRARNPFEAAPSYKVIGDTVLQWLDELRNRNVSIKKIFFDGFLPSSKRETRIARIKGYTRQLNEYYQSWPQIIPFTTNNDAQQSPINLFNAELVSSTATKLPAAPFLVPAVIETLSQCKRFESIVEVVPGEADVYCAQYVKNHGGTVITGDSDLLVHDLGSGKVTFFRDIEPADAGSSTDLKCVQYDLEGIAKRLELPESHGLRSLAFEMKMDSYLSFRELLRRAVKLEAVTHRVALYREFAAEYEALPFASETQDSDESHDDAHRLSLLQKLDPRISEYVLQFPKFAQTAGPSEPLLSRGMEQDGGIKVFLPFLLDCPVRTSAWEMSTYVRQLAYSLINLLLPVEERVASVVEHRRLQSAAQGREWEVPTNTEIPDACASLVDLFGQLSKTSSKPHGNYLWRVLAIYQDTLFSSNADKAALSSKIIGQSRGDKAPQNRLTWDVVHFFAQLQGSYYSFRMLKQIMELVLAYDDSKVLHSHLYQLQAELKLLPDLREMPNITDAIGDIGGAEDKEMLAIVRQLLQVEDESELPAKSLTKKDRRKRKLETVEKDPRDIPKRPNNIFEMLHTD